MNAFGLSVLVIEDNDDLRQSVVALIKGLGFDVRGVSCAEDVDDHSGTLADIYVVDLNLPGEDGTSLAQRIRATQPEAVIVMTTARTSLDHRINGYLSGADVYLPKPVAPAELTACLRSIGRRLMFRRPSELTLSFASGQLRGPQATIRIQQNEAAVLAALARAPERTLERWQLEQLFGIDVGAPARAVLDVRISRLRRKLAEAGAPERVLLAVPNIGYRLCQHIEIC
ncbi:MAG: response regulator [Steroidobacteraceae bacterium]